MKTAWETQALLLILKSNKTFPGMIFANDPQNFVGLRRHKIYLFWLYYPTQCCRCKIRQHSYLERYVSEKPDEKLKEIFWLPNHMEFAIIWQNLLKYSWKSFNSEVKQKLKFATQLDIKSNFLDNICSWNFECLTA